MSLLRELSSSRTEEDIKDAYIKALGLDSYFKGLVDIQTDEIWFEAKFSPTPPLLMFAQLLVYVRAARKKGEPIPGFLSVVDRDKAALLETEKALPIFDDKSIVWPRSGSKADNKLAASIAPYVETHYVVYDIANYEKEFVRATHDAIKNGKIIRTPITPDNLRQVFDRWMLMIGTELADVAPEDFAVLFFADIMHDGISSAMANLPARLFYDGTKPNFLLNGKVYELASERGYYNFWKIYHRPPGQEHRHYLLERRDSLLPTNEQKFKGAFYTPLHIVDRAYEQLTATLGENWQKRYIVWDMCAGVGNLEAKHSNLRNVFMSTLDQADVTIMKSNPVFSGATIFQYDYLNDDIDDFGNIDFSITDKVPEQLRKAIYEFALGKKGAKPILVLINPPYAEATNDNTARGVAEDGSGAKKGVAKTKAAQSLMTEYGKAKNELFAQFLVRTKEELPGCTLAMFSTLKYVLSPTLEGFRDLWRAKFLDGFVVHSRAFDGVGGDFPIGFLIWDTNKKEPIQKIVTPVLDKRGNLIDEKTFLNKPKEALLTTWIKRPKPNKVEVIPLKNAITAATAKKDLRGTRWSDGALGYMWCNSNDLQQANKTALFSSGFNGGHGLFVTPNNLWQAAIVFSVRRLIKPTWLNDRDQFLQAEGQIPAEFRTDCLVWMLFNGSNLSAGANDLEWNGRRWSVVNHFIPFTEADVRAKGRFESDFMSGYMADMDFSDEAGSVIKEGRALWQRFHSISFPQKIRNTLKLNRPDAGWYQVRNALEAYQTSEITDFDPFRTAYSKLTNKLRPKVFEMGFLPN